MKRETKQASHDRWLVSYADFITLLFAFFVVLYASAQVDRKRMNQLSAAIQAGFQQMAVFNNAATSETHTAITLAPDRVTLESLERLSVANQDKASIERMLDTIQSELRDLDLPADLVSVRPATDGVVVSLREVGFFDSGSAHMRTQAAPLFAQIASLIADQRCQLRIEGHTDNMPIHNAAFNSNWELSTARATEVIRLLVTQYGFNPQDLSAAGYAEFHPIASNDTAEGRSANRRIDIVVLTRACKSAIKSGQ
jgi:chemotaxis protein MotB